MFDEWPAECRAIAEQLAPMLRRDGADFYTVGVPRHVRVGWPMRAGSNSIPYALLTVRGGGRVELRLRVGRDSGLIGSGLPMQPKHASRVRCETTGGCGYRRCRPTWLTGLLWPPRLRSTATGAGWRR